MSKKTSFLDKKSPYLFFIKFLACFFILYFFFDFYWGITGQGGRMYSPFLANHFNIIRAFSAFLTSSAKLILELFNFNIHQPNFHTLRIETSKGISVNPTCLGWGVMSFWVAFVFANTGAWRHKLKWMVTGLTAVILLNISRIVLIAVANHLGWQTLTSLDHHQTFNILSYGCIFIFMFWYIKAQKKYETIDLEGKPKNHTTSPIQ